MGMSNSFHSIFAINSCVRTYSSFVKVDEVRLISIKRCGSSIFILVSRNIIFVLSF